jgi:hypothetical protein
MKLAATSSGNTGVAGRQHMIVDMQDIVWGDFLQGVRIALDELSSRAAPSPNRFSGAQRFMSPSAICPNTTTGARRKFHHR